MGSLRTGDLVQSRKAPAVSRSVLQVGSFDIFEEVDNWRFFSGIIYEGSGEWQIIGKTVSVANS